MTEPSSVVKSIEGIGNDVARSAIIGTVRKGSGEEGGNLRVVGDESYAARMPVGFVMAVGASVVTTLAVAGVGPELLDLSSQRWRARQDSAV